MGEQRKAVFWIPLLLAVAFLCFGLGLPTLGISLPMWLTEATVALGLVLIVCAGVLAYRQRPPAGSPAMGGEGGKASAKGTDSYAKGGRGGNAGSGSGGAGGTANARGKRSAAEGGEGGRG